MSRKSCVSVTSGSIHPLTPHLLRRSRPDLLHFLSAAAGLHRPEAIEDGSGWATPMSTPPWTTTPASPTARCWGTSGPGRRWASGTGRRPGSPSRALWCGRCSPTTAPPTAADSSPDSAPRPASAIASPNPTGPRPTARSSAPAHATRGVGVRPPLPLRAVPLDHPVLRERGFAATVEHPEAGQQVLVGSPWIMSRTQPVVSRPSPMLGQHSAEVFEQFLGMSTAEYEALVREGVSGDGPPGDLEGG